MQVIAYLVPIYLVLIHLVLKETPIVPNLIIVSTSVVLAFMSPTIVSIWPTSLASQE